MLQMFVLALSLYNTWNRGVFLLCKITNLLIYSIELISLFSRVLKENRTERDLLLLRNKINLISITGSVEVVKALNEYINTWGRASGEVQNEKYRTLLQVMRKDLNVDKKIDEDFPSIGLCDINVKR